MVTTEQSLIGVLKMVLVEIKDAKFNGSRRRVFLTFLESVEFRVIKMCESTWRDLITALRFIANQADPSESDKALSVFSDIIAVRPYETSWIITLLKPQKDLYPNGELDNDDGIDLASLGANKATDFFILKFLLCDQKGESHEPETPPVPTVSRETFSGETVCRETVSKLSVAREDPDDTFTITDQASVK